ncbi:hypothetical protein JNK13_03125 [bacterium]|nr:hypothetical protein [bacterium]
MINAAHLHLVLAHLPVILIPTGLTIAVVGRFKQNTAVKITGASVLLIAGMLALPVYFSGGEAEEIVERLPGIVEEQIEAHEEIAEVVLILALATAVLALVTLFQIIFAKSTATLIFNLLLVVAMLSSGFLAYTSNLGGKIRHSEIDAGRGAATQVGHDSEHDD